MNKILIIDDENGLEDIYRKFLERFSCEIVFVDHPQKAWKEIDKQHFDLIITDLKMPVIEGDEFIKIVRNSKLNNTSPIILCSGHLDKKVMSDLTRASKIYFLNKPFDSSTLIDVVSKSLDMVAKTSKIEIQKNPNEVMNSFLNYLSVKNINKLKSEEIKVLDQWNFESILINFQLEFNQQLFNINLITQFKTALNIAGKVQGTNYKEIDIEPIIIWENLLKDFSPHKELNMSFFITRGFSSLNYQAFNLKKFKLSTEFGDIYIFIK